MATVLNLQAGAVEASNKRCYPSSRDASLVWCMPSCTSWIFC